MVCVIKAWLRISWDDVPNFCFLKPAKDFVRKYECMISVTSRIRNEKNLNHLAEITGGDSQKIKKLLATLEEYASFVYSASHTYFVLAKTPPCPLYEALLATSLFKLKEEAHRNYIEWCVMGKSLAMVGALVKRLKMLGVDVKVVRIEKVSVGQLTAQQERVLRQAFDLGFFDIPRKTNIRNLAKVLELSPSTVDRLLRSAIKKIVAERLTNS